MTSEEQANGFEQWWHEYCLSGGGEDPHGAAGHFYELGRRHGRLLQKAVQRVVVEDAEALEILRQYDEGSDQKASQRDYSGFPPEDPIYNPRKETLRREVPHA